MSSMATRHGFGIISRSVIADEDGSHSFVAAVNVVCLSKTLALGIAHSLPLLVNVDMMVVVSVFSFCTCQDPSREISNNNNDDNVCSIHLGQPPCIADDIYAIN